MLKFDGTGPRGPKPLLDPTLTVQGQATRTETLVRRPTEDAKSLRRLHLEYLSSEVIPKDFTFPLTPYVVTID